MALLLLLLVLQLFTCATTSSSTLEMRRVTPGNEAWLHRVNAMRTRSALSRRGLFAMHSSFDALVVHALHPRVSPLSGGTVLTLSGEHLAPAEGPGDDAYRCSFGVRVFGTSGRVEGNASAEFATVATYHALSGDVTCRSPDVRHHFFDGICKGCHLEAVVQLIAASRNASRLHRFAAAPVRLVLLSDAEVMPVVNSVRPSRARVAGGTRIEIHGHFMRGAAYACAFGTATAVPAEPLDQPPSENAASDAKDTHALPVETGSSADSPTSLLDVRAREAAALNARARTTRAAAEQALSVHRTTSVERALRHRAAGHGYGAPPRSLGGGHGSLDVAATGLSWDSMLVCVAPAVAHPGLVDLRVTLAEATSPLSNSSGRVVFHYLPPLQVASLSPRNGPINGGTLLRLVFDAVVWQELAPVANASIESFGPAFCRFGGRVLVRAIVDPFSRAALCVTPPAQHLFPTRRTSSDSPGRVDGDGQPRFTTHEMPTAGAAAAAATRSLAAQLAQVRSDLVDALASEKTASDAQAAMQSLSARLVGAGVPELALDGILGPSAIDELAAAGHALTATHRSARSASQNSRGSVEASLVLLEQHQQEGETEGQGPQSPSPATSPSVRSRRLQNSRAARSGLNGDVFPPGTVLRPPGVSPLAATLPPAGVAVAPARTPLPSRKGGASVSPHTVPLPLMSTSAAQPLYRWLADANVSDAADLVSSASSPLHTRRGGPISPRPRLDPDFATLAEDILAVTSAALVHVPPEAAEPLEPASSAAAARAAALRGTRLALVVAYVSGFALGRLDRGLPRDADAPEETLQRICRALGAATAAACPLSVATRRGGDGGGGIMRAQTDAAAYVCASVRTLLHARLPYCAAAPSPSPSPAPPANAAVDVPAFGSGVSSLQITVEVSLNAVDFDAAPGFFTYHDPVSGAFHGVHSDHSPHAFFPEL